MCTRTGLSCFPSPYVYTPLSFKMECLSHGAFDLLKQRKGMVYNSIKLDSKQQKFVEISYSSRGSHKGHKLSAAKLDVSVVQSEKQVLTYLFHTEGNGQLKVLIKKKNNRFRVRVELLFFHFSCQMSDLVMVWGLFRSDSSKSMPLDFEDSNSDVEHSTIETPFMQEDTSGTHVVELDFESSLAPFYVSFVLKSRTLFDTKSRALEIRTHRKTSFVVPVGFGSGNPFPFGLSFIEDGSMNIALFSRIAESVVLCFYDDSNANKPIIEIDLDPYVNRSGDIWHASIDNNFPFKYYAYRCKTLGNQDDVLLDPYAKVIGNVEKCTSTLCREPTFDWGRDVRPYIPMEELIVYRLNAIQFAGNFNGIMEKLNHIKTLGVNAILLEPVFLYDDEKGPYFPLNFFSPGLQFGSSHEFLSISKSLKEMVKIFHSNGMEIFLEVVFTHTAKNASLYEIDKSSYYHLLASENLLNCNYPIVMQMILDSLRHWVIEYHIDGFCFVNSSALLKGFHGEILSRPPLIEAISFDPILSKVKLISDSWDPHDTIVLKETVDFPHWKRWAEINHKYCLDVRNFVRGKGGTVLSRFATRLCGSADTFLHGRGPSFSFNFVARSHGLTLVDSVSYSNETECSWNCGEEGPTNKMLVLETRLRQIRNFLFILFMSHGVPVINMGDECGLSYGGSIYYKDRNPFDWSSIRTFFGVQTIEFISFLSALRFRRRDLLQRREFLREENIEWHGKELGFPLWDDINSKFLAMTLKVNVDDDDDEESVMNGGDLFMAFNGGDIPESVVVPSAPVDLVWYRLVDTGLSFPGFFSCDGPLFGNGLFTYEMQSHSCVLFEARSPPS